MKYKPLCVVQTEDKAIKFFDAHDPILFQGGPNPMRLNVQSEGTTVALLFCKRCGATYVGAHSITFAEVPKDVTPSPGGSA